MKYKIYITETVTLRHEMVIDGPTKSNIDNILDAAQDNSHMDDARQTLLDNNCKIISFTEDDGGDSEIEFGDFDAINESEEE